MALQVWLPLNGNLNNIGVSNLKFSIYQSTTTVNSAGKIGSCYTNNSNSSGGIVSDTKINLGNCVSMFCWVKMTSFYSGSNLTGILGQHRYHTCEGLGITMRYVSSTTGYISINTGNGSGRTYNTYYGSTLLNAGTWYHVGFTYNNGVITFYVNGKPDGTATYANKNIEDYIQIFGWSFASSSITNDIYGDFKLYGFLNDVRIYDHCLSEREVYEIAKGLVVHYPLNDPFVEETINLVTSLSAGGQTTVSGKTVTTSGTNADTYFTINLSESIVVGTQYTISCMAEMPKDTYWNFPLGAQSNTSLLWTLKPGYNTYTFTANDISWGSNGIFMDDISSGTARTSGISCKFYNFQLEKKDHATGYTENARGFKYDPQVYIEPDGSHWARIAHHNNPASYLFSSSSNWSAGVYVDSNRWFNVYSVVNRLNSYEFMVKQTSTSSSSEVKYRWIQYTSPLTATYANVAPSAVTRITTSGYTDGGYGGLYILNSYTHMVIANTSNGNWYGAFGCWTACSGGIPGYPNTGVTSGYMDLYVRIDSIYYPKVIDRSGNGNHGTITGGLTINNSSAKYDKSTYFDGSSYSTCVSPTAEAKTLSLWAYIGSSIPTYNVLFADYKSKLALGFYTSGTKLITRCSGENSTVGATTTVKLNSWNHFVVVKEPANQLYVNGSPVTMFGGDYWTHSTDTLMVGIRSAGTGFVGYISDVRLYATALSADDVKDLYTTSAIILNKGDLLCFMGNEIITSGLGKELGPYIKKPASNVTFNTDGSYTISGHTWPAVDYIPINPIGKTYYYDVEYSNVSGNLFYIGFSKFDSNYGSTGSNEECQYIVSTTAAQDHARVVGTINLSTANGNIAAYTKLRILNDWNNTGNTSYKGTIHHISLKEVYNLNEINIDQQGIVNCDDFIESTSATMNNIGNITCNELIEN